VIDTSRRPQSLSDVPAPLAPFLSVIKDPEPRAVREGVLLHGCRRVKELAYGEMITEKLPTTS